MLYKTIDKVKEFAYNMYSMYRNSSYIMLNEALYSMLLRTYSVVGQTINTAQRKEAGR